MQPQSKAIILARVSSRSQEDEGYSLDSQLKLLRDYCKKKKLNVVQEFKITETASKTQRRKVFQELLAHITKNKIHHFAVEKTDRATRNIKDAAHIYDWIEGDEKRVLHCVKEGLELHKWSTSQVKFMWGIFVTFAKQYTDSLREEAMKGWAEKLAQGWLPAPPPPGYMTVTEDYKRIHIPNPDTMALVQRAFELYTLPDHSIASIRAEMTNLGLRTGKGRPFATSHVHRILGNPFYIGVNRFNGKDHPGAQEPIISRELFDKVQEKLHRNHTQRSKHNHVFQGMLRCVYCDSMVTWQQQKGHCYGGCQRRSEACKGKKYLREDRVERLVIQKLEELEDPKGDVLHKLKATIEMADTQNVGKYRQKMIHELTRQAKKLQYMEENLYDDRLAGFMSKEKYQEKQQNLAKQREDIAKRLAVLREAQQITDPQEEELSDNPIVDLYLKSTPSQKRIIMANIFKKMDADGDQVSFIM